MSIITGVIVYEMMKSAEQRQQQPVIHKGKTCTYESCAPKGNDLDTDLAAIVGGFGLLGIVIIIVGVVLSINRGK